MTGNAAEDIIEVLYEAGFVLDGETRTEEPRCRAARAPRAARAEAAELPGTASGEFSARAKLPGAELPGTASG